MSVQLRERGLCCPNLRVKPLTPFQSPKSKFLCHIWTKHRKKLISYSVRARIEFRLLFLREKTLKTTTGLFSVSHSSLRENHAFFQTNQAKCVLHFQPTTLQRAVHTRVWSFEVSSPCGPGCSTHSNKFMESFLFKLNHGQVFEFINFKRAKNYQGLYCY